MKRKLLVLLAIVATLCLFIVSVSAAVVDKTEKVTVTLKDGSTTECALYDADGDELVWYTLDEGATLVSVKAKDLYYTSTTHLKDIYLSEGGTALQLGTETSTNKIVVANLRCLTITTMTHTGYKSTFDQSKIVQYVYLPSTITTFGCNQFQNCTKLKVLDIPSDAKFAFTDSNFAPGCTSLKQINLTGLTGVTGSGHFSGCSALDTIIGLEKSTTNRIGTGMFKNTAITEVRLSNTVTNLGEAAFNSCKNLKVVYLGAALSTFEINSGFKASDAFNSSGVVTVYMPSSVTAVAGYTFSNANSLRVVIYTGTKAEAMAMYNASIMTANAPFENLGKSEAQFISYEAYMALPANDTGKYIVYGYNKCSAFYGDEHDYGEVSDCTADASCTRECGYSQKGFGAHVKFETLAYANGFDKAGVYNCVCANANYCTAIDGYALNKETAPVVTFKGYSVPENASYKGINAGFKIDKELLADYNEINDVDASLTLFMVNSANIEKILDGETLELASGVKGINVKITSTSYTDIGIAVRGFDNSSAEGNYYTLNLITAIAVKTESGIHYVQAGLKTVANTTQSVGGIVFNTVNADKVYSAVAQ